MTKSLGKCPLCLAVLHREGEYLVCPQEDYKILESTWDQTWKEYEESLNKDALAEVLLSSLQRDNILKVRTKDKKPGDGLA